MEWFIRQLSCPSIINLSAISIAHTQYTDICPQTYIFISYILWQGFRAEFMADWKSSGQEMDQKVSSNDRKVNPAPAPGPDPGPQTQRMDGRTPAKQGHSAFMIGAVAVGTAAGIAAAVMLFNSSDGLNVGGMGSPDITSLFDVMALPGLPSDCGCCADINIFGCCNVGDTCGSVFDFINGGLCDIVGCAACNPCMLCQPCVGCGGQVLQGVGGCTSMFMFMFTSVLCFYRFWCLLAFKYPSKYRVFYIKGEGKKNCLPSFFPPSVLCLPLISRDLSLCFFVLHLNMSLYPYHNKPQQ